LHTLEQGFSPLFSTKQFEDHVIKKSSKTNESKNKTLTTQMLLLRCNV
jgi:hypothetical protein